MNKPANRQLDPIDNLKFLVEAVIFENNPDNLFRRIEDAQDAIMDHIEVSFETASRSERQSMINAMNSLRQLQRLVQTQSQIGTDIRNFYDA